MTLFTLLIVMALERVMVKTKTLHIATLANTYFAMLTSFSNKQSQNNKHNEIFDTLIMLLVAGIPSIGVWLLVAYLPTLFVFFMYLALIWICLGCPVTRKTYKNYLQAANREDFVACSLYSEKFGNKGGDLSKVGKQLVLVNYRQYASVIIFFVILGLPGMVFYSLCKEWYFLKSKQIKSKQNTNNETAGEVATTGFTPKNATSNVTGNPHVDNEDAVAIDCQLNVSCAQERVMFIIDWLPSRITALGFLLVGHFSRGLPVWIDTLLDFKLSAYDVLAKVAKASEEPVACDNPQLQEPLQMVKLVKRNIVFFLMAISTMTLVGVIS